MVYCFRQNLSSYFNVKFHFFILLLVYIKVCYHLDFRNQCFSLVKIITSKLSTDSFKFACAMLYKHSCNLGKMQ